MSGMDEYKDKIKKQMDRPMRSAREELMGGAESKPEITSEPIHEQQEMYIIEEQYQPFLFR
ncbi:hypothetical protein [Bacillus salipaludis]|uniref:Uncharacterized protein n=1 Tax=Bacillus salipaludis TaxID=2547811 RepID=A0AA90Z5Z6_9BACI|nr:hypothetical protein [Bacillus salipaludis]MDQ6600879.1 hypothetical protein [Bacillus salipaludis]